MNAQERLNEIDRMIDEDLWEPNAWERNFLDSVEARLLAGQDLSEAQEEKLEEIWKRAVE